MRRFRAMRSRFDWDLARLSRRAGVRVTLFAVLVVATAASAPLLQDVIPEGLAHRVGSEAVRPILDVLATGMLAGTTFPLSVTVASHRTASQQVTPRAHWLLLTDTTAQTVLASFLGAFLYAIVSIVLIDAGVFDSGTIVVRFLATPAVITLVVLAMLRRIDHLSGLGSMRETTRQEEKAVAEALGSRLAAPSLGCRPATEAPGGLDHVVTAGRTGYVGFIDLQALAEAAAGAPFDLCLAAEPGGFVTPEAVLARVSRPGREDTVRSAFGIGDARTFDQDPRFGLIVLSEIASHALSPGLNDPGTAIEDAFGAIARDGAGIAEVQIRVGKGLAALARGTSDLALAGAATRMAARALDHARGAGHLPEVMARIERALPAA